MEISAADRCSIYATKNKDYPAQVTVQQKAEGARQAKDAARIALEKAIRPITNFVQGYTKTTDADRATLGSR